MVSMAISFRGWGCSPETSGACRKHHPLRDWAQLSNRDNPSVRVQNRNLRCCRTGGSLISSLQGLLLACFFTQAWGEISYLYLSTMKFDFI